MEKLSFILWSERDLVDQVSFRWEVERLLASGRSRWLVDASRGIEEEEIRATEVLRAIAADEAAAALGLSPDQSLATIAAAAPEPWSAILMEHRDALVTTAREIAALSEVDVAFSGVLPPSLLDFLG